jgi:hypothetical protein
MRIRPFKCILLGPVLALLLVGHALGAAWWSVPPSGQPMQMQSKLDYDLKLTDPFFASNKRPKSHTAKCFSTSREGGTGKHLVIHCDARLVDANMIDLLIHHSNAADDDALRVLIKKEFFTCQYWTLNKGRGEPDWIWTTKGQKLTLDKKTYRKGDVIKGRIDFECVQEPTNPEYIDHWGKDPRIIKVYGVFKTIVK